MYKIKSETARLIVCCLVTALITAGACTKYYNYKTREMRYGIASELSKEGKLWVADYIDKGKKSLHDGNYLNAFTLFDAAANLDKNNRLASELRSEAYLLMYKPEQPLYNYFLFEKNKNDFSKKAKEVGTISKEVHNFYPAESFIENAKKQEKLKEAAYLVDGLIKVNGMRHLPADELLTKVIEINPSNGMAYAFRAAARGATGQVDKAEQDFAMAEKIIPGSTRIAVEKALMYLKNERPSSALKTTDKALEADPDCFDLWLLRSLCLLSGERYEEAEKNLTQLEKYYPNWWQVKMAKGVCAEKLGRTDLARAIYAEADVFNAAAAAPEGSEIVWQHRSKLEQARKLKTKLVLDKPYDINVLFKEVIDKMFKGDSTGIRQITWSKEPLHKVYGVTECDKGVIEMNCNLNSSQIPKEHIKKVIYHECLHAKGYVEHDKEFYAAEARYPNCANIKEQMSIDTFFRFER